MKLLQALCEDTRKMKMKDGSSYRIVESPNTRTIYIEETETGDLTPFHGQWEHMREGFEHMIKISITYGRIGGFNSFHGLPAEICEHAEFKLAGNDYMDKLQGWPSGGEPYSFTIENAALSTFEGFPDKFGHDLSVENVPIKSFKGFPSNVGYSCNLHDLDVVDFTGATGSTGRNVDLRRCHELKSFRGIDKLFSGGLASTLSIDKVRSMKHILHVMNVPNLRFVSFSDNTPLSLLINEHLDAGHGKAGVVHLQNALLDAGYDEEFASL
jgi:hypothetical protein